MNAHNDSETSCPLCGGAASQFTPWAWHCSSCGVRFSSLEPHIDDGVAQSLDEDSRENGLRAVRDKGHAVVLDEIGRRRQLAGSSVLDIGSGHGWFLEAAQARGMSATGVEPDRDIAERAIGRGLDVRVGFFPQDLPAEERFDVIAFNDVLEHLPDLPAILAAVDERLRPEGLLAISIPTADGLGYRTAVGLARMGVGAPLDRLWQREFPSPHLWYFTESALARFVTGHGFQTLGAGRLPSVEREGLRERVGTDPRSGWIAKVSFAGVYVTAPIFNHERFSDAMWLLFKKQP
jgi:SAM-dependent methyltransferase